MKITTLKIKADNAQMDFAISDYYLPNSTIYSTTSKLVKEKKEYYWLIMIAYKAYVPKVLSNYMYCNHEQFPEVFKEEVNQYFNVTDANSPRLKNRLYSIIDNMHFLHSMEDFQKIRGLGTKTIEKDYLFLEGLLQLINNFRLLNTNIFDANH